MLSTCVGRAASGLDEGLHESPPLITPSTAVVATPVANGEAQHDYTPRPMLQRIACGSRVMPIEPLI